MTAFLPSAVWAGPAGWNDADLIDTKTLADRLKAGDKPVLLHVGFGLLYRTKHIPGTIYAGPGNKPEGIADLRKAVGSFKKDQEIVVYCGCCPWVQCPNMKPAFEELKKLGFKNVKALMIETNFKTDWTEKGYPVTSAPGA